MITYFNEHRYVPAEENTQTLNNYNIGQREEQITTGLKASERR